MVRAPRGSAGLPAGGLLLALACWLSPVARCQDPPERSPGTEAEGQDGEGKAPGKGKPQDRTPPALRSQEPPSGEARKSEKAVPGKPPAEVDGRLSREDDELAIRILEIEQAIWREVESVESRLRGIKERLRGLRGPVVEVLRFEDAQAFEEGPGPFPPGEARRRREAPVDPADLVLPADGILFSDANDEVSYRELLRRQEDVLRRWRRTVPPPDGKAQRRPAPAGEKERVALREELRAILGDVLDLREKAREKQIEGLRREIDDIERAIHSRREGAERGRLIERRLEDLLGPTMEPLKRRLPE